MRHRIRALFIVAAVVSAALMGWIIYYPPASLITYSAILIVLGMLSSVYVYSYSYAKDIMPPEVQSTTMGFINTLCVGTVPIFQPLIGYMLDVAQRWHGHVSDYTVADYQIALAVMPVTLLIAAILAYYADITHGPNA